MTTYQFDPQLLHDYLFPKYPSDEDFIFDQREDSQTLYDLLAALIAGGGGGGGAGVTDGNKGDITVSGTGLVWTINNAAVSAIKTAADVATQAELDAVLAAANAKVADAIVDGVTTVAPSQNAVFDALALLAPKANPTFTGDVIVPNANADTEALNRITADARYWPLSTDLLTQAEYDAFDDLAAGTNITLSSGVISVEAVFAAKANPITVVAGTDQTVNNSTTLVNDGALVVACGAIAVYEVVAFLIMDGSATSDFKLAWTHTGAGTWTMHWTPNAIGSVSATSPGTLARNWFDITGVPIVGGHGGPTVAMPIGYLTTDATAGNLQLQWAQNTAEVSDSKRKAGSRLVLRRIV